MKSAIDTFLISLYPKRCRFCGEVIEFDGDLCDECRNVKKIEGKICNKCGREEDNCICKKSGFKPDYNGFCAPYYYEDSVHSAIHNFKDKGYAFLSENMAREIYETVRTRFKDVRFDFVCFVPMRRRDVIKRKYNQSQLLANEVAALLDVPCKSAINKIRKTKPQKRASSQERSENLFGAFEVDKRVNVSGKTVLIVDDVKTTGSTLSECAAMLKIAGAKKVYACAFTVANKK